MGSFPPARIPDMGRIPTGEDEDDDPDPEPVR